MARSERRFNLNLEHSSDESRQIALRPKSLAVLHYLKAHAGRVIGKDELLAACWPDVQVSPHALKVCIREIRAALGDDADAPRFIETIPRQGYRFISGVVSRQQSVAGSQPTVSRSFAPQDSALNTQPSVVVGRETELAQIHAWLEKALSGQRQVVFVTGEPGIGKTALVDAFLAQIATDKRLSRALRR